MDIERNWLQSVTLPVLFVGLASIVFPADASDTLVSETGKLIKASEAVSKVGDDLFGDKVNIYTGGLEFVHQDVTIPGNSKLPVAVGRRMVVAGRGIEGKGLFANWDIEIPHIHGMFSDQYGFQAVLPSPAPANTPTTARCTNFGAPPAVYKAGSTSIRFRPTEYWRGHSIYIPGGGDQEILLRNTSVNTNIPSDGVATPLVTKGLWAIRCLSSLASSAVGTVPANEGGEGFLAISPDGTQYKFDWLVSRPVSKIYKSIPSSLGAATAPAPGPDAPEEPGGNDPPPSPDSVGVNTFGIDRREVFILPTLITDRYGNTVQYTYDSTEKWKLLSIRSADGAGNPDRLITFTYVPGTSRIETASDGTRTWRYSYTTGGQTSVILNTVTLPDNSTWQLAGLDGTWDLNQRGLVTLSLDYLGGDSATMECDGQPEGLNSPSATGTMVHPSGATGRFTVSPIQHARNGVPRLCYSDGVPDSPGYPYYSQYFDVYGITSKTISGPGLSPLTWTTSYNTFNPGWTQCTTCLNIVTVTEPEGNQLRYSFGSTYGVNEAMLQKLEVISGGSILRSTSTEYETAFTQPIGFSAQDRGDAKLTQLMKPEKKRIISQQGVDFTWQVPASTDFDKYYRPTKVTKSSTLGYSRPEAIAYHNNTNKWILGQIASVTETGTGRVMESNGYNATTANLETVSRFGKLERTMTYNADGTLATSKDPKNPATSFTNYKRGIARNTSLPDGKARSAAVNDIGKIASFTDEAGFTTSFGFDAMGRVSQITYPTGDTVAWSNTSIVFEQVPGTEYDIGAGHWRQNITTGNQLTSTIFDALWRPVYVYKADITSPSTTSSIFKTAYDSDSNVTFTSYPQRTQAQISGGVWTQYDALGRATNISKSSELGTLTESYVYGGSFNTQHTNSRSYATTISYQAFDEPVTTAITNIAAPEGVNVAIGRNVFGTAKQVTRSGNGKSVTRTYVHDANERLCKTIEPEIGSTVQDYDLASNVAWKAIGLALPSTTSCDIASVPANKKITYGYDALNRITSTTYGDASPSISRTYTPDGLPLTTTSNGTTWTYGYNKRRLLESESLAYGGVTYAIGRNYDTHGNQSRLTYPDGAAVDLAPNALGQPTKVGTYATGVSYHPNGAIAGFTYGNGITHSLTQNARGLPDVSTDVGVLKDKYAFDANANVTGITDSQESISTRSMTYDGLDRLLTTSAPSMWGSATYTYDALDNLTSTTLSAGGTARTTTMNYPDPNTNRLASISGTAGYAFSYGYDSQGNITQRGVQTYVFDQGNRIQQVTGKATYIYDGWGRRTSVVGTDGVNRVQVYSQDGQILYMKPTSAAGTKYIYLHKHVIAEVGPNGTQYQHTDGLGGPVARTTSGGALQSRTRYEPYGYVVAGSTPVIGFAGHVHDAESGLTYMQQRFYDPVAGRFLSVDPVTTDVNTGASFNRYAYANNSPYKYIDPDGRDSTVKDGVIKIEPKDQTVPRITLPNTVGATGVSSSSSTFHTYDVRTPSNLTNAAAVGRGIANSPTPGPGNLPASPSGTVNNAGGIPTAGNTNLVKSFSVNTPDAAKFTNITVNYTVSGAHGLTEGFVIRYGEISPSNGAITLRSYGEGNSWRQAPALEGVWGPQVQKIWGNNQQNIINGAQ
jgi:RHS repeat-associated protein